MAVQTYGSTVTRALESADPDSVFITMYDSESGPVSLTFGRFAARARGAAAVMRSYGVQRQDRVILIMDQGIPLMTAFVGAMYLGAVPAILAYPTFKIEPHKYRQGLAGVSANLAARLTVVDDGFPTELRRHFGDSAERLLVMPSVTEEVVDISDDAAPADVAFIQHSAGTTGLQKGVVVTHEALLAQLAHLTQRLALSPADRIYSWLPLYHDMGLVSCFMLPLVYHVPLVLQSPTEWVTQPATMLEAISRHRCTVAWVPNFALNLLARRVRLEDRELLELSCLRALINCSEPVQADSIDEFYSAYSPHGLRPGVLQASYAMAENVFAVTQTPVGDPREPRRLVIDVNRFRLGEAQPPESDSSSRPMTVVSSGSLLDGNEVRVVSATGDDLSDRQVGEILVRSDSLFSGYFNRPDLTDAALSDGWYHSGDLGFLDKGDLFVTGRKRDLIVVAGKNIYPQDIEAIAWSHPSVHDGRAVAFGVYNRDLGTEDIMVVVETHAPLSDDDGWRIELDLRSAILGDVGVAVRRVFVKPPLWIVKSTAGKAARSATRDKLLDEHPEIGTVDKNVVVDGQLSVDSAQTG